MKWVIANILSLVVCNSTTLSQEPFITTWKTGLDSTISIPTGTGSYNYDVDWGDGTSDTGVTGSISHKYPRIDTFTVEISGSFPQIIFYESGQEDNILRVDQWGDQTWSTMLRAFSGCSHLEVTALDTPDLSQVLRLSEMFQNCTRLNQPINHWNISNVRYMHHMFAGATSFNQPLDGWNVSGISSMSGMFENATSFNQDLSMWNTESVTVISNMFSNATSFDQSLGSWDLSSIAFLQNIFSGIKLSTENYDSTLIGWARLDPGETSIPVNKYFAETESQFCAGADARDSLINVYNWVFEDGGLMCPVNYDSAFITTWQPENDLMITIPVPSGIYDYSINWGDGKEDHNVSGSISHIYDSVGLYIVKIMGDFPRIVMFNSGEEDKLKSIEQWGNINWTSMLNAFRGCNSMRIFATDAPDLSMVTNCSAMLAQCDAFNQPIGHWNTSNVENMSSMFFGSNIFNQNINEWDVSKVKNMSYMFNSALDFNQPLDEWDVSSVTNMRNMFTVSLDFNQDISGWDVQNVENMTLMFSRARRFNQPIGKWKVFQVTNMSKMFDRADDFDQNLGDWDISNVENLTDFLSQSSLSPINYDSTLMGWSQLNLKSDVIFDGGTSSFCLSQVRRDSIIAKFNWSFNDGGKNCDTYFKDALIMTFFTDEDSTITLPTTGPGYHYLIDWGDGDTVAYNITGNISHKYSSQDTITVKIAGDFPRIHFNGVPNATDLLSINQWGDIEWRSMESAFDGCTNLQIMAIDTPDLSQVLSMKYMFRKCGKVNSSLNHWDVSKVENMSFMFDSAIAYNQSINAWQTPALRIVEGMFQNAFAFNQDISNLTMDSVKSLHALFRGASSFNHNLQNWNLTSVEDMSGMFASAISFSQDLGDWHIINVTNLEDMFDNAGLTTEDFDKTLLGWRSLDSLQMNVTFNAGNSTYCYGQNVISYLQDSLGWNLQNGGLDPNCNTGSCPAIANFYDGIWDVVPTKDRALYIWDDYDTSIDGIFEGCTLEVFEGIQMQVHPGDTIDVGNIP